ncbi:leucine-rich melanocyte differentiation-associated protein isoform X1 [Bemisia tabaci]|uniref:leucine-rich melanocyte differentiation-associated protein isoform X1 n=1 Tax=Bemisia tabaci TaxID=7038 RepID=UPI003B28348B
MPVTETFSCTFRYALELEIINKLGVPKQTLKPAVCKPGTSSSHICFTVHIHSKSGTNAKLSYVGQDVHKIPSVLSKLYGSRVHELDLSYNCLTSLSQLEHFPHLTELILDNNQLGDSITFPYMNFLHTLSLNKNNITDLESFLRKVELNLPNLRYLSLLGNVACPNQLSSIEKDEVDYQRYRYYVLHHLPQLQFLDSRPVSQQERQEAAQRGQFMKVVRPLDQKYVEEVTTDGILYTPLPSGRREAEDHQGVYGKCVYRYAGAHSEGNRFIQNNDL